MTGGLRVVEATPADARDVLALHLRVLMESTFFISEPTELRTTLQERAALIAELGRQPASVCLVARRHDQLLGYLTVTGGPLFRMRHTGKLEILVDAAARGQGVGRALMAACIAWAEANPAIEKLGLSVFADNARAIRLYEAHGFEVEGRRAREYKLGDGTYRDDVLMYRFV